ncbi:MAG: c-type cytochrome [Burkholderiales bacterium]
MSHHFIKTPKQLIILIIVAFTAPILFFFMLATLMTSGFHLDMNSSGMSPEAVAERLKPVGQVVVAEGGAKTEKENGADAKGPEAPAPVSAAKEPAASSPAPEKQAAAEPAKPAATGDKGEDGKSVYDTACAACHATGLAGAPTAGDKAQWAPRIGSGVDALYASALKGKGAMPAKGGNPALSDVQVKAAVDFMVGLAK